MILVTGATGTVGRDVVRRLAGRGVAVRALIRDAARGEDLELPGVEVVQGDLARPETLERPFRDVERLFLASARALDQAELQSNAIAAAQRAGVEYVVKLSALGAGPESPVQALRLHAATEEELRRSGLGWTILQPNFFMQTILGSASSIVEHGAIHAPAGEGKASLVDARDVASVAAELLAGHDHLERTLVLTGPEPLSYTDVAEKLSAVLGRAISYVALAPETARERMRDRGIPEWVVDDLVVLLSVIYAQGYASPVTTTVEDVTGAPARRFEAFAAEHADAFEGAGRAG